MSLFEIFFVASARNLFGFVLLELVAAFASAERNTAVAGRKEVRHLFWIFFAHLAVVWGFLPAYKDTGTVFSGLVVIITMAVSKSAG